MPSRWHRRCGCDRRCSTKCHADGSAKRSKRAIGPRRPWCTPSFSAEARSRCRATCVHSCSRTRSRARWMRRSCTDPTDALRRPCVCPATAPNELAKGSTRESMRLNPACIRYVSEPRCDFTRRSWSWFCSAAVAPHLPPSATRSRRAFIHVVRTWGSRRPAFRDVSRAGPVSTGRAPSRAGWPPRGSSTRPRLVHPFLPVTEITQSERKSMKPVSPSRSVGKNSPLNDPDLEMKGHPPGRRGCGNSLGAGCCHRR